MLRATTFVFTFLILTAAALSVIGQGKAARTEAALYTRAIETFLDEQVREGFSGSVLVARAGKVLMNKPYGSAAMAGNDVRFWIASGSKSFVAAAIIKLQEQGKLSVGDPITKFFASTPADKHQITIHHLLTHTSGLPHKYAADGIFDRDQAVQAILSLPLSTKPGEKFGYSNDGYTLLAAIVEIASKKGFEDYLRSNILRPAGLGDTGFWGYESGPIAGIISGRGSVPETVFRNGKTFANWGYRGATGMYSTAGDLYDWMVALRSFSVLKPESIAASWGKHSMMQPPEGNEELFYGYGWTSRYKAGRREFIRHPGFEEWLGHSSVMIMLENQDAVVVLSNSGRKGESVWASYIETEIRRRLGH